MTTLHEVIERTRRHLYGGETRDERNRLSGSITADAVGLGLGFSAGGIAPGVTLAIELEELYVWEVSGVNVTVARAEGGSTAATHAIDTPIFVNPKHSAFSILQAINEELDDLSSPSAGLFKVDTATIEYQSGTDAYDLTGVTDLLGIIDVTYDAADGTSRWPRIRSNDWKLRRDLPAADFASGLGLTIDGYASAGRDVNVVYKTGFTHLASLAQEVTTISGLPATAVDILSIGAAIRLTVGSEVARNFLDQGDTRRAEEVPPQARANQMRALSILRRDRISAEKARLYAQYPVVR